MNNHEAPSYDHLLVSRRIIPVIVSLSFFLLFVSFMLGYFLGVKYTTDEFITQIRQETLANQLMLSALQTNQLQSNSEIDEVPASENTPLAHVDEFQPSIVPTAEPQQDISAQPAVAVTENNIWYGAELIGFGTKKAAREFIDRVACYNSIPLELKEHQSKTPRGRRVQWYQVVTGKYEKKQELQAILDMLIKREHIHDIKIVAYTATKKDLA